MANNTASLDQEIGKNRIILGMIRKCGFSSVREFCRQNQIDPIGLGKIIRQTTTPAKKNGLSRLIVVKLAECLECSPEDFFSEPPQGWVEAFFGEMQVNAATELAERALPDRACARVEDAHFVEELLQLLNKRQRMIMRLLYGVGVPQKKFWEVAEMLDISITRVIEVKERALHKLKEKGRKAYPKQFMEYSRNQ